MTRDDDAAVEALWVLRAQLGAPDAYARLVDRHDARLGFYLRRLVGSRADADDLRQDVWITVVRKLVSLEDPCAFRGWLYRIAHHRAISWLRRRRVELPLDDAGPLAQPEADDDDAELDAVDAAAMHAALETLGLRHREILTLRFQSELSYEEIARVLDCRVGTVRSRLHYAKAALREALPATPAGETDERRTKPTGDPRRPAAGGG